MNSVDSVGGSGRPSKITKLIHQSPRFWEQGICGRGIWYHSKSFRLIPSKSQLHENISVIKPLKNDIMKQNRLLIFWWLIYGFQQIQKLPFVNSALSQRCWWYIASNACSLQSSAVGYASPTSTSINWNSLPLAKSEDLEPEEMLLGKCPESCGIIVNN